MKQRYVLVAFLVFMLITAVASALVPNVAVSRSVFIVGSVAYIVGSLAVGTQVAIRRRSTGGSVPTSVLTGLAIAVGTWVAAGVLFSLVFWGIWLARVVR